MRLTLELDDGQTFTIQTDKEPEGHLLETMQDMCILLDDWAHTRPSSR
jgi:hypothetical protein